jgi:integrase
MSSAFPQNDRFVLRLFTDDGESAAENGGVSIAPDWEDTTLPTLFEEHYLPVKITARGGSDGTATVYRDMLAWWVKLTGSPPVRLIDDYAAARFIAALAEQTYRRGRLGQPRPLKADTRAKYGRCLRALLRFARRLRHPGRPGARLLDELPEVPLPACSRDPKRPFPLETCRAIWRACDQMADPTWWRSFVALLFYTGFRSGTVMGLEWSMLETRDGLPWLNVPSRLVPKTSKPVLRAVHAVAAAAIEALPSRGDGGLLLPTPHTYDHVAQALHDRLQAAAGVPVERRMSPQAWRRTHSVELARSGFRAAQRLAQWSLDHDDSSTTAEHYCDLRNEFILRMPRLDGASQALLF